MDKDILQTVSERFPIFDRLSKETSFDLSSVINRYAWVSKDGIKPQLRLAHLNAVDPPQRLIGLDDENVPIWYTATTFDEDRDGDIVVPQGVQVESFRRNPVIFFGHQELAIPIAKGVDKNDKLMWIAEENRCRGGSLFDTHDSDAMFIRGKILRGFLNAVSIAFVPIRAFKRGGTERHKAEPRNDGDKPVGYVFEECELTETSWVGCPANAGAIRDSLDREKSFISPRCQKVYGNYAAKSVNESGGCFTGWCCPCEEKTVQKDHGRWINDKMQWLEAVDEILRHTKGKDHTEFPNANIDRLFADKASPKQAAVAIVSSSRGKSIAKERENSEGEVDKDVRVIPWRGKFTVARLGENKPLYEGIEFPTHDDAWEWAQAQRIRPVKGKKHHCNGCSKKTPCGKCKKQVRKNSQNDCVSRKIPIFKKEHPDWDQKHCIAAAEGWCRENKSLATTSGSTGGYTVAPTKSEVQACYTRALASGDDPATACGRVERRLGINLDVRKDGTLRGFVVKSKKNIAKRQRRKSDEEDMDLEDETEVADEEPEVKAEEGEGMEETDGEDEEPSIPKGIPHHAETLAAGHQHLSDLKNYYQDRKMEAEPERAADIDKMCKGLDNMLADHEKTFTKLYPDHDLEETKSRVKEMAAPPENEGQPEGLEGEDGYTEMAEMPENEEGDDYVSMDDDDMETKGDEDAEEILDRYRNGGKGKAKKPVRRKTAVKKTQIRKGSTCMAETHEFLQSLANGEEDPVKRAAMSHHAQRIKEEMSGTEGPPEEIVEEGLGMPSGGPPEEGMETVARDENDMLEADMDDEDMETKAAEGMEELDEDKKQPAKSKKPATNGRTKALANGVTNLSKEATSLTDGLLEMKRKLGLN